MMTYYEVTVLVFEQLSVGCHNMVNRLTGQICKPHNSKYYDVYDRNGELCCLVTRESFDVNQTANTGCRVIIDKVSIDGIFRESNNRENLGDLFTEEKIAASSSYQINVPQTSQFPMPRCTIKLLGSLVALLEGSAEVHELLIKYRMPNLIDMDLSNYGLNIIDALVQYLYAGPEGVHWGKINVRELYQLALIGYRSNDVDLYNSVNNHICLELAVGQVDSLMKFCMDNDLDRTLDVAKRVIHRNIEEYITISRGKPFDREFIDELKIMKETEYKTHSECVNSERLNQDVERMCKEEKLDVKITDLLEDMRKEASRYLW